MSIHILLHTEEIRASMIYAAVPLACQIRQ
jgi:hypothetical protein